MWEPARARPRRHIDDAVIKMPDCPDRTGGRWQSNRSSWPSVGLQWIMRRWLAVGTLGLAVFLGGCSTATQSGSSTSTSPSHSRTNANACSYVQSWAKDPMTFELFSALAASAGSAKNPELHDEGKSLSAAIPSHSAETIGNVLDKMVHTCIELGLFKAPTVGSATQAG